MNIQLDNLKILAGQSLLNSIYNKTNRLYFFFGQTTEFDLDAPPVSNSLDYINETRNNIFSIKEILPSDASFVIPRKDYQQNIEYNQYDTELNNGDHVYNPTNYSVYICTKRGEGVSTIQPSHDTAISETYSDGYSWRYIYTIPLALRDRFLTPEWIPVTNSLSENYFSNGGIDSVSIIDSGDGYHPSSTSVVALGSSNKGHGAVLEPVIIDGKIVSVIIHENGYGYIAPKIIVSSPTATRTAVISPNISKGDIRSTQALIQTLSIPGTIETVRIKTGGSGYTEDLILSIQGDGEGATVEYDRNITTGEITNIRVTNKGEGYTWAKLVIEDTPVIGGSGLTAHINISPVYGFGRNAVADLKAESVMIYQTLSREKISGLEMENSIRQYGIIANPKTTTNSTYPKSYITKTNYLASIPLSTIIEYPVGTTLTNELPVTATTKNYVVEEQIIGKKRGALRIRALNGGDIVTGGRYFKSPTVSFVADQATAATTSDRQFVSACYELKTTSPNLFNINTFTIDKILINAGNRFVIVANSSEKILVSSIDGGKLVTGDTLIDEDSNTLTPEEIIKPTFDKKSGSIITIEKSDDPVTYGQMQSLSFRTIINF